MVAHSYLYYISAINKKAYPHLSCYPCMSGKPGTVIDEDEHEECMTCGCRLEITKPLKDYSEKVLL
jgi:rRNA maturation endonuclease Nob1